eukprot:TRINITY_DN59996_c0_g1_i1.p1 TRINITY_DN59996_c0_g1~~TRINITY_DN59996_c0_g1_i1.p1  ORF type:complete len:240 (-),score=31.98 TRINITY_DN59996_c0_g1_i1:82-801(-)
MEALKKKLRHGGTVCCSDLKAWNPGMAKCYPRTQFEKDYAQFMRKTCKKQKHPRIHGQVVDLWYFYNVVTMLGGVHTVWANAWFSYVCQDNPVWWADGGIAYRLKEVYLEHLWEFEQEHFKGKNYQSKQHLVELHLTAKESSKLTDYIDNIEGVRKRKIAAKAKKRKRESYIATVDSDVLQTDTPQSPTKKGAGGSQTKSKSEGCPQEAKVETQLIKLEDDTNTQLDEEDLASQASEEL